MVKVVRASQAELEAAVDALRDGELVAFPTETVYGLGANASNPAAVRKVFELKGRPSSHPVIVHIDQQKYLKVYDIYAPLFAKLTPEAKKKLLKGNYERLFDKARSDVRAWEKANLK